MEEDLLKEINKSKFEEIICYIQKDLPISLSVLNLLKSFDKEDPSKETELKVFCPKGEISSGVFVVTLTYHNESGYKFVNIHCSEDKASILQQALDKTRKLSWVNICFEMVYLKLLPNLESMLQNQNIPYTLSQYTSMLLPPESYEFNHKVVIPEELIIRPLTSEDARLIDERWDYHSPTTYDYIHHSIEFFGGLGLVDKHNGKLVSWAVGVWNTIGMVHTMPNYRHRGYAEVVVRAMGRKLVSNNIQPVCFIKHGNIPSLQFFKKLGFIDTGVYCCVTS